MPPREKGRAAYDERATDDVCALLSKTHDGKREGGAAPGPVQIVFRAQVI